MILLILPLKSLHGIYGADLRTKGTPRALLTDDPHLLPKGLDGIKGACLDAPETADAFLEIDPRTEGPGTLRQRPRGSSSRREAARISAGNSQGWPVTRLAA